jgi:hypothetical protein
MDTPKSDIDCAIMFIESSQDILRGTADRSSKDFQKVEDPREYKAVLGKKFDLSVHEAGKVVNMLVKGNVNFVWFVLSPKTYLSTLEFEDLKKLVEGNLSKNIYHSINGMAVSSIKKYFKGKDITKDEKLQKRAKIVLRTLRFGISLIRDGLIRFAPAPAGPVTLDEIKETMDVLGHAYECSKLPDTVDEKPFRDWLLKVRMAELHGQLRVHDLIVRVEKETLPCGEEGKSCKQEEKKK